LDGLEAEVEDIVQPTPERSQRIVLFGLFGVNNLGNDATLDVALFHLRKRLPGAEVLCVAHKLSQVAAASGVTLLPMDPLPIRGAWRIRSTLLRQAYIGVATMATEPLRMWRVAQLLRRDDLVVILGTGVLDDFGASFWDLPAWLLRWCWAAKTRGAALQFVAVGAGPIVSPLNRLLMTRAVRLADHRSYRDTVSKQYLERIGVDTERDRVVPDLVFSLPQEWLPVGRPAQSRPTTIAVGLMGYFGWDGDRKKGRSLYESYISKMTRFVSWLLEQGYRVRLMVGELGTDEPAVRDVCAGIAARCNGALHPMLSANPIESLEGVLREIAGSDAVIATRFHNVICALTLGRPVIAIGYSNKFDALMREMDLESYCQHIEALDVDGMITQFQALATNYMPMKEAILSTTQRYREELDELYDTLCRELFAGERSSRGEAEGW